MTPSQQQPKYYLAGPMTGYPSGNVPQFLSARDSLVSNGFSIQLPFDLENQEPASDENWSYFISKDIEIVLQCQGMVLLPEWWRSRGAKLEVAAGLMQSLKYPFQFFKYLPSSGTAIKVPTHHIADDWYEDWNTYSKVPIVNVA